MLRRPLGATGIEVSALGLGTGPLGSPRVADADAGRLLNLALDLGVTLVDTAPSYGEAERRIGRHLAARRDAFVLSTKGGYGVAGVPDWTGAAVAAGIDAALSRLRTDRIDVLHLHSCPLETLRRDDVLGALERAVLDGKVRIAAYSGENRELAWAVDSGRFGAVQCSVNVVDRAALDGPIARAAAAGIGVIAKRPLANAAWREPTPGAGPDVAEYRRRFLELAPGDVAAWPEAALRFAAFAPGVSSAVAGSANPTHLRHNLRAIEAGPLPADVAGRLRDAFEARGRHWPGLV